MANCTKYCNEEQTKKAFALGFYVDMFTEDFNPQDILPEGCEPVFINARERETRFRYWLVPPTTEQLIDWLESQDAIMEVQVTRHSVESKTNNWGFAIFVRKDWDVILGDTVNYYYDRKAATLAAIDAALDYLSNK